MSLPSLCPPVRLQVETWSVQSGRAALRSFITPSLYSRAPARYEREPRTTPGLSFRYTNHRAAQSIRSTNFLTARDDNKVTEFQSGGKNVFAELVT
jgi:hypothetical protein